MAEKRKIERSEKPRFRGPFFWVIQEYVSEWMIGFWRIVGGLFRWKSDFTIESHTFPHTGCQAFTPMPCEHDVQKVWFSVEQQRGEHPKDRKWNFVNVSWGSGQTIIHADIESAPCTIKWFNIC